MTNKNDYLITEEIQNTINKLYLRISDRFPNSGLSEICKTLHNNSLETNRTLEWIAKPIYTIRILAYSVIIGIIFATAYSISISRFSLDTNMTELIATFTSALESGVIVFAVIAFIITFKNKRKRIKIISSINKLRCIVDNLFAKEQKYIWTGDSSGSERMWSIGFLIGVVGWCNIDDSIFVRPVRNM